MTKQALRERVWDELEASGEARFPFPPHGRIPNFAGADDAAERLADTLAWASAERLKANPDAPQLPARRRALRDGTTVFVAVPRLRDADCFRRLDPDVTDVDDATTVGGIDDYGVPAGPEDVGHVDLILVGSVAVTTDGARVGKGEGYSDLEFAVLSEFDAVDETTTVATTVHERQVVDEDVPVDAHDVPLDVVVTPERTIETETPHDRPAGVDWGALSDERVAEMPVLARLAP
ncbi:MAG: 5-formyltetrahydrofolate cyclo-ligase [Halobacteriaceae archaeon]